MGEQADPVIECDGNRISCHVRRANGAIEDIAGAGCFYNGNTIEKTLQVTLPPLGPYSPESHFAPLVFMLEGMIQVNRHHIRQARDRFNAGLEPFIPPLSQCGVKRSGDGGNLADLYHCMQHGGNPESLAIWR